MEIRRRITKTDITHICANSDSQEWAEFTLYFQIRYIVVNFSKAKINDPVKSVCFKIDYIDIIKYPSNIDFTGYNKVSYTRRYLIAF